MGCWNETCFISNLAIRYGDKCRMIIIKQSDHEYKFHATPSDLWEPVSLPIEGTYDDYGSIFFETDDYLSYYFNKEKDSIKAKEDEYDKFDFSSNDVHEYVRCIERGYLFKKPSPAIRSDKTRYKERCYFSQIFVLEEIYQHLINYQYKDCNGDPLPRSKEKTYQEMLKTAETYKRALEIEDRIERFTNLSRTFLDMDFRSSIGRFELGNFKSFFSELIKNNKDYKVWAKRMAEFIEFEFALHAMRKAYHPTSGSGSQQDELDLNEEIYKLGIDIIEKRRKQYQDYDY